MTTADFYVGLGDNATWLGSLSADGSTADMDDYDLFGPDREGEQYDLDKFVRIVNEILDRGVENDRGYSVKDGDMWPWPYQDSGDTDMVYCWVNGSIHVFEKAERERELSGGTVTGQTLVALHYPNGARKISYFRKMA